MRPIGLDKATLVDQLRRCVREIYGYSECQNACKKMHVDLARRMKLLSPLFEELMCGNDVLREEDLRALESLRFSLNLAKELLVWVNCGSKIFQALQMDRIANKFCKVTKQIEKALNKFAYDKLNISEEVREQIELLQHQFKRAVDKFEFSDTQLDEDLATLHKETDPDPAILKRISQKLQIQTSNDVINELIALHEVAVPSEISDHCFEMMSSLLVKLSHFVASEMSSDRTCGNVKNFLKYGFPVIPDDFRCPISFELMKDPVIVSTGQSYERSHIQKWMDLGHKTCPKTQQTLPNTTLTPNYALKSLISVWCESNGVELKDKQDDCKKEGTSDLLSRDSHPIISLIHKVESKNFEQQRVAAGELRLLTKRSTDYRVCYAEAGVIPLLVKLLSSPDPRIQEHAVTTLLNLSINDTNKVLIANADAIPEIVRVLRNGNMEARENAAATLFSLSALDAYKAKIGSSGAIPALVDLLHEGTPRGKTDAATAIFNICLVHENRARAISAGILGPLLRFLKGAGGGMLDEALALLAILVSHPDGRAAVGEAEVVPVLVEIIRTGSPRKTENAISVLWWLCFYDSKHLRSAMILGGEDALRDHIECVSDRGRKRAEFILDLIQEYVSE